MLKFVVFSSPQKMREQQWKLLSLLTKQTLSQSLNL